MTRRLSKTRRNTSTASQYAPLLDEVASLVEQARRRAATVVNNAMTELYWNVGRLIVNHEQGGARRAAYGADVMDRLANDLTARFGRGFSRRNLEQMRAFFLQREPTLKAQSPSALLEPATRAARKPQTASALLAERAAPPPQPAAFTPFPLPWSHYVILLSVESAEGRAFYEAEAARGGWTVRQLKRQVASQFYERTALSRNRAAMLRTGQKPKPGDAITPEEAIKDPLVLEFLGLKDEYSESDLESALITRLETFLLELGGEFAFIGRQRRLRVGDAWYRIDLLFFHRRLRCLVVIDLKVGEFTHADAGQMHLYLNYAREHWRHEGENPPVGLILCTKKDTAVAKYALEGLPNKVLAAEYRTALPHEKRIAEEIAKTRRELEGRK